MIFISGKIVCKSNLISVTGNITALNLQTEELIMVLTDKIMVMAIPISQEEEVEHGGQGPMTIGKLGL